MDLHARLSGVSFHLPDADEAFPRLVGHLDDLHRAVLKGEEDSQVLQRFHLASISAIRVFRREEEAMALCRDKGASMHRGAHQMFLKNLSGAQARFKSEGASIGLAHDIRSGLVDWMVDHHHIMNANLGRVIQSLVERSVRHHQAQAQAVV